MTCTLAVLISVLIIIMLATIARLSRTHDHLQEKLDKSYAEIEKMKRDCDAQVQERTAAIMKVNKDLQYEIQERMKSEERLLEQVQLLKSKMAKGTIDREEKAGN
ncbi:MAG: hypothetical protein ABSB95_11555 [Dissulfurispiraceae bacterium]|jgi:C4-dicarboxylate-specific signal transduction histidine kinase